MSMTQPLLQLLISGLATLCFGVLFAVPARHYLYCAATGAAGWMVYYLLTTPRFGIGMGPALASLLAVVPLAGLARGFAIWRKAPITIFLFCGIFPLVPGAGIYYTAYYFIQGDNAQALSRGIETFKIAVGMALGIAVTLSVPLPHRHRRHEG